MAPISAAALGSGSVGFWERRNLRSAPHWFKPRQRLPSSSSLSPAISPSSSSGNSSSSSSSGTESSSASSPRSVSSSSEKPSGSSSPDWRRRLPLRLPPRPAVRLPPRRRSRRFLDLGFLVVLVVVGLRPSCLRVPHRPRNRDRARRRANGRGASACLLRWGRNWWCTWGRPPGACAGRRISPRSSGRLACRPNRSWPKQALRRLRAVLARGARLPPSDAPVKSFVVSNQHCPDTSDVMRLRARFAGPLSGPRAASGRQVDLAPRADHGRAGEGTHRDRGPAGSGRRHARPPAAVRLFGAEVERAERRRWAVTRRRRLPPADAKRSIAAIPAPPRAC